MPCDVVNTAQAPQHTINSHLDERTPAWYGRRLCTGNRSTAVSVGRSVAATVRHCLQLRAGFVGLVTRLGSQPRIPSITTGHGRAMLAGFRRIGRDLKRRKHLDAYAVGTIAFVFAAMTVVGDAVPEQLRWAALLAGVGTARLSDHAAGDQRRCSRRVVE